MLTYLNGNVYVSYGDQHALVVDGPTPDEVAKAREVLRAEAANQLVVRTNLFDTYRPTSDDARRRAFQTGAHGQVIRRKVKR